MYYKKAMSLLEIMIVIFLIGLISSVVGFNLKGSLEKGKAFKTEQMKAQIEEVLTLELAQSSSTSADDIINNPEKYLKNSPFIKDPQKAMEDGWGQPFELKLKNGQEIQANSRNLDNYKQRQRARRAEN